MATTIVDSDLFVNGALSSKTLTPPASSITDASVVSSAGIQASKCQQEYNKCCVQCDHATNAAAKRQQIHKAHGGNGTILAYAVVASVAATGNATITVDLKKNGSSILSSTITLDSTTAAFAKKLASGFTSTSFAADDVFEADITAVNAGTGTLPKGVSCHLVVREDPQ